MSRFWIHELKQEFPTYLKLIGKSKALAATISDTKPKTKSDDDDDKGILSAFTAIVASIEGIIDGRSTTQVGKS